MATRSTDFGGIARTWKIAVGFLHLDASCIRSTATVALRKVNKNIIYTLRIE
jgi:hypothetical protein